MFHLSPFRRKNVFPNCMMLELLYPKCLGMTLKMFLSFSFSDHSIFRVVSSLKMLAMKLSSLSFGLSMSMWKSNMETILKVLHFFIFFLILILILIFQNVLLCVHSLVKQLQRCMTMVWSMVTSLLQMQ